MILYCISTAVPAPISYSTASTGMLCSNNFHCMPFLQKYCTKATMLLPANFPVIQVFNTPSLAKLRIAICNLLTYRFVIYCKPLNKLSFSFFFFYMLFSTHKFNMNQQMYLESKSCTFDIGNSILHWTSVLKKLNAWDF